MTVHMKIKLSTGDEVTTPARDFSTPAQGKESLSRIWQGPCGTLGITNTDGSETLINRDHIVFITLREA